MSTIARRVQSYLTPSYLTRRQGPASDESLLPSAAPERAQRYPEIDVVKGIALINVLLIHAGPLEGTALLEYVVNRAVPVLLVLFGASSELWWMRRAPGSALQAAWTFCRARYARLLPPVWAALAVWWAITMLFAPQRNPGWPWPIVHAFGYMPQVGTGWFVTLIVQLVVLFPLLHVAVARAGWVVAVVVSLGINVLCHLRAFDVIDLMRAVLFDSAHVQGFFVFYYSWIFAPKSFWPVVVGIVLARRRITWPVGWSVAALMVWAAGAIVHEQVPMQPFVGNALMAALDIPCALLLLDLARHVTRFRIARWLEWIGKASWGMYLAQLLIHTTVPLVWLSIGQAPRGERWLYFAALLIGSVIVVQLSRMSRTGMRRLREHKPSTDRALASSDPAVQQYLDPRS